MAYAIFRSPMSFFETTPSGRILNRFSRYVVVLLQCAIASRPSFAGPLQSKIFTAWSPSSAVAICPRISRSQLYGPEHLFGLWSDDNTRLRAS